MADADAVDRLGGSLSGDVTVGFDVADIEIVGEAGAEAEVPNDLSGDLGIVWIDERKWLAGDVVLEHAVLRKGHLCRVLLGSFLIWRRPFVATGRNDLELHALFHEEHGSRTDQGAYLGGVVAGDEIAGFDLCVERGGEY